MFLWQRMFNWHIFFYFNIKIKCIQSNGPLFLHCILNICHLKDWKKSGFNFALWVYHKLKFFFRANSLTSILKVNFSQKRKKYIFLQKYIDLLNWILILKYIFSNTIIFLCSKWKQSESIFSHLFLKWTLPYLQTSQVGFALWLHIFHWCQWLTFMSDLSL